MKYAVTLEAETRVSGIVVVEAESDTEAITVAVAKRGNMSWELVDIPSRSEILRYTPCVDALSTETV